MATLRMMKRETRQAVRRRRIVMRGRLEVSAIWCEDWFGYFIACGERFGARNDFMCDGERYGGTSAVGCERGGG